MSLWYDTVTGACLRSNRTPSALQLLQTRAAASACGERASGARPHARRGVRGVGARSETHLTINGVSELGVHAIDFQLWPSGVDTVHASWVLPVPARDCGGARSGAASQLAAGGSGSHQVDNAQGEVA